MPVLGDGPLAGAIEASLGEGTKWCWVAYDSSPPPSYEFIRDAIGAWEHPRYPANALVVISTSMPVGTCSRLSLEFPDLDFAVVPENIRAAHAHEDWMSQPYLALGTRKPQPYLHAFLNRIAGQVITMSPSAAEMLKCATNTFLALQIEFGNCLGRLSVRKGITDVEKIIEALRADPRIGSRAYLMPGDPPGEHLDREVDRWVAM